MYWCSVWCGDNSKVGVCSSVSVVIHKVISKLLIVLLVWMVLWIELWISWGMRKPSRGIYPVKNAHFTMEF